MTGKSQRYVGVDWANGDWVAVCCTQDGPTDAQIHEDIEELFDVHEDAERIVIDIPIGLCDADSESGVCGCEIEDDEEHVRTCDKLARKVVGDRYPSVFNPPARKAAKKASNGDQYGNVKELNEDITGKGLTRQAANLSTAIMQVDGILPDNGDEEWLLEGHPEVCFCAFNGSELNHSKTSAGGVYERLNALEQCEEYQRDDWMDLVDGSGVGAVDLDDLLDALALSLTAIADFDGDLNTLPGDPCNDEQGLPMQMVYRADTEFDI
jgi:predicted RNase H-like nuclease